MTGPAIDPARFGPREAQPLGSLIADAQGVLKGLFSREGLAELAPFAQASLEREARLYAIAARLFGSAEGEELLEALCDATMRRPIFVTQLGIDPMQALVHGAFREGQAAAVYLLLAWLAKGRTEQPPTREGHHVTGTGRGNRREGSAARRRAGD